MPEPSFAAPRERATTMVRFGLVSIGAAFGKAGFYRLVGAGPHAWKVRNFTTLHELFHVYVDQEGILRTDHEIHFVGLTILRLHYKMTLTPKTKTDNSAQEWLPAATRFGELV